MSKIKVPLALLLAILSVCIRLEVIVVGSQVYDYRPVLEWLFSINETATLDAAMSLHQMFASILVFLVVFSIALLLFSVIELMSTANGEKRTKIGIEQQVQIGELKKCPYCAEYIRGEAIVCRYCATDLPESTIASNK